MHGNLLLKSVYLHICNLVSVHVFCKRPSDRMQAHRVSTYVIATTSTASRVLSSGRSIVAALIARSTYSPTGSPGTQAMAAHGTASADATWMDRVLRINGADRGPLCGLTFAAKDIFDIEGHKTGFGSPEWLASHPPATATAPPVQALLNAGATLVGKVAMDELAYSIDGENAHYGTPPNPAAPGRIPGGSSSGSAVVVAASEVDFSLGTDTGGSVRVPASYCGILGLRPTHGRISLHGCCPLAESFDTCGFFARDAPTLRRVGRVVLGSGVEDTPGGSGPRFRHMLIGDDAFGLADAECAAALREAVDRVGLPFMVDSAKGVDIVEGAGHGTLTDWWNSFRILQAAEAWKAHGKWVTEEKPHLGPGIKDRFDMASAITDAEIAAANVVRADIRRHMDRMLGNDTVLVVPSVAGIALKVGTSGEELIRYRQRALSILCIAGMAGLPQVSLPLAVVNGCPMGLGIIGPRGSDEALLDFSVDVMKKCA